MYVWVCVCTHMCVLALGILQVFFTRWKVKVKDWTSFVIEPFYKGIVRDIEINLAKEKLGWRMRCCRLLRLF